MTSADTHNPLAADLDHVLSHSGNIWDVLRNQRIFITGGTGFFGRWLLESFCWANDKLSLNSSAVVLTRNPQAFAEKAPHLASHSAITLQKGDVVNFGFPIGQFRFVIHAATESGTTLSRDNPLAIVDTIVAGTRRVLDFARLAGTREFLLTSSGAVYGPQTSDLTHIPEEYGGGPDPLNTASAYGESKRVAEQLCCLYHQQYSLEPKIARCFAFLGPYLPLDAHFAAGNFLRDGLAGGPIRVGGDGTPYRSYLYPADLAVWLWSILLRGSPCRAYNVGSDAGLTVLQLAEEVASCFGVTVTVAKTAVAGKTAERYVPSVKRAAEELGLLVNIGLRPAIERTIRWHRANAAASFR